MDNFTQFGTKKEPILYRQNAGYPKFCLLYNPAIYPFRDKRNYCFLDFFKYILRDSFWDIVTNCPLSDKTLNIWKSISKNMCLQVDINVNSFIEFWTKKNEFYMDKILDIQSFIPWTTQYFNNEHIGNDMDKLSITWKKLGIFGHVTPKMYAQI